jgi:hypothetical protein
MAFLDDRSFLYHLYASIADKCVCLNEFSYAHGILHTASVSGICINTCMQHTRAQTWSTSASSTATPLLSSVSTYHTQPHTLTTYTHTHTNTHTHKIIASAKER